jgi:hypothetical protein
VQFELEPTALVIFEDRQCPHLLGSDAAEIDNWMTTVVENEVPPRIENQKIRDRTVR